MILSQKQIAIITKNISRRDGLLLLADILNSTYSDVFLKKEIYLTYDQYNSFLDFIKRCENHEPIAKIIGKKEFYGIEFKTSSHTLDPRPETELLIDLVQKYFPNRNGYLNILDLGTGTGCIGLSLLMIYKNSTADLVDISENALKIAKINADQLNLNNRARLIKSNWFANLSEKYDAIVSNPPYVCEDFPIDKKTAHDPKIALFSGKDGLNAYREIFSKASDFLLDGGYLFLEIGFDQRDQILKLASKFKLIEIKNDLSNIARSVVFQK